MTKEDGGPACYMTLRDHFAAAALTGLLARCPEAEIGFVKELTESSYQHADAMLAARAPKPAPEPSGELPF